MESINALDRLVELIGELQPGTVALVGAGPGDCGLISVRGALRIAQADVVLHDKLVAPELLDLIPPTAERIFVGKWRGARVWTQDEINAALVDHARAGKRVVRLKGGDPFVFGRGGEECEQLFAAGVPFEVVPGITAAFGAPAAAGIPLTHRGMSKSFTLVTAHGGPGDPDPLDFATLAKMETIALYMGVKHLAYNCSALVKAGMDAAMPVALIQSGTLPQQQTIVGTLGDIAGRAVAAHIQPPALVLIGKVVALRDSMEWFEKRPLHGQRIVVTRMREQAASLSGPLITAGAEVIEAPTIAIVGMDNFSQVDETLRNIARYAWLVLTSANGVDAMFARLQTLGADTRALAGVKIAAIGTATAARLSVHGIRADLLPTEAVGESLADALIEKGVHGQRVLLLRADLAREQLPKSLAERGAECDDLPIYRTVCPPMLPETFLSRLESQQLDWITFTSPSSLHNLLTLLGGERSEKLRSMKIASIGPVTTRAIREAGYQETVEANPHDVPGLVAAIGSMIRGNE